jgi:23S rRNA pseudouridine1911/1915/1917 synthase
MIQIFEVEDGSMKVRADKWVSGKIPEFSRNHIQKAFDDGLVKINGEIVSKSAKLSDGDVVEFSAPEIKSLDLTPKNIPLSILYEDEHIVVLDKQSGMVVHPGAGTGEDTLVHALLHHCKGQLSGIGGVERPGIVHRLDRETSGVMVIAKTDVAHRQLAKAFAEHKLTKQYLALVAGVPDRLSGSIQKPIGRNQNHRHKMCVRDDGRPAHTDWELLGKSDGPISLLRCRIHTGRTHQIRVHLSNMGFPILGDEIYGYRHNRVSLAQLPARTLLHAYRLKIHHPVSLQPLELIAPPPEDFQIFFPNWRECLEKMDLRNEWDRPR